MNVHEINVFEAYKHISLQMNAPSCECAQIHAYMRISQPIAASPSIFLIKLHLK